MDGGRSLLAAVGALVIGHWMPRTPKKLGLPHSESSERRSGNFSGFWNIPTAISMLEPGFGIFRMAITICDRHSEKDKWRSQTVIAICLFPNRVQEFQTA